jgi:hypothetical protein
MIIIDPTEARESSRLPTIEGAVECPFLEEATGADIMISPLIIPALTEELLRKHIVAGALLIQRKSGDDLLHSLGDRLNSSLARMRATGARQAQCVLLFIGRFDVGPKAEAIIDGSLAIRNTSYWGVQGAFSKWHDRGGVVEQLHDHRLLADWIKLREKHVNEYVERPIKDVYRPTPDVTEVDLEVLQTLRPVNDWRVVVAALPGIGPKRANALQETMKAEVGTDNLVTALIWLTTPWLGKKVPGIGDGIINNLREFMQLEDIYAIKIGFLSELSVTAHD